MHRDVRHLGGGHVGRGEHAVGLAVARRRGAGEAGIAGEREFDCGGREGVRRSGSGSRTTQRSSALAASSVSASGWSVRASVHWSSAGLTVRPVSSCLRTRSALASMSRPVSTKVISLRKPPMLLSETLSVGGGGSPCTPLIRTRSGPSSDSSMVSTRA